MCCLVTVLTDVHGAMVKYHKQEKTKELVQTPAPVPLLVSRMSLNLGLRGEQSAFDRLRNRTYGRSGGLRKGRTFDRAAEVLRRYISIYTHTYIHGVGVTACIQPNIYTSACPTTDVYVALCRNLFDRISYNEFFNIQELSQLVGHSRDSRLEHT
jgi:hypothetical protein